MHGAISAVRRGKMVLASGRLPPPDCRFEALMPRATAARDGGSVWDHNFVT